MSKKMIVAALLSIVGFVLIGWFTASPDVTSGNGNPAILFIPVAIVPYIVLLVEFARHVQKQNRKRIVWLPVLLFGLIVAGGCEFLLVSGLIYELGGGPDVMTSRIYRFGWFNQYTNTFYFNVFTYLSGLILTGMVGTLFPKKTKEEEKREKTESEE